MQDGQVCRPASQGRLSLPLEPEPSARRASVTPLEPWEQLPTKPARQPESTPTESTRSEITPRQFKICRFCLEGEEGSCDSDGFCLETLEYQECAHCEEDEDDFVHPCPCRGSAKFVHLACLVQHFVAQGEWHNFRCPTCKQTYEGRALRELAKLSQARMEQEHGPEAPQVAHSLCYLAQAHAQLGNIRTSKELLERGLSISEARFGSGHIATAATLAELASAHGKMGDVQKQKEFLERSLAIKEEHFGPGHINTAVTLNNLATAHSELGNVQQEKALLERSLEIKEKHYGRGHIQTTAALVNLAGVYSELGDVQQGLIFLELSLQIEERHYGAGHVETAITLNNLALAHGEGGDTHKMRELLLRSLKIKERHFGFSHQELCLTLANLGMACAALCEWPNAEEYCNRAQRACSEIESQPFTRRHGVVLLRAASVHLASGQGNAAERSLARCTTTLRKALGRGASKRVLQLECTRMARIWAGVGQDGIVKRLEEWRNSEDDGGGDADSGSESGAGSSCGSVRLISL